ncbi:MAG: YncE family protein, partial [Candidatus Bipolaricaulia bacterium]
MRLSIASPWLLTIGGIVFALTFLSVVGLSQTDLYLYVPNAADGTVSVVDLRTNQPVAAIPVGEEAAHGIAVSPDGQTVWVGGSLFDVDWLSAISVVDTRTRQVVAVVSPGIGDASHFSFTPDGQEAWIASVTNNLLWVVDTQTYAVRVIPIIQPFTAPVTPEGVKGLIGFNEVAVGPDGRRIYAISPETGVLYDLEAKTGRLIRTAQVG